MPDPDPPDVCAARRELLARELAAATPLRRLAPPRPRRPAPPRRGRPDRPPIPAPPDVVVHIRRTPTGLAISTPDTPAITVRDRSTLAAAILRLIH